MGCMLIDSRGGPPILRGGPPLGTISMDQTVCSCIVYLTSVTVVKNTVHLLGNIEDWVSHIEVCRVWHYRLLSFQGRDTKLERFLHKDQL